MPAFQTIDAKTAKSMLDKKEAVIIDVREPAEFSAEHIPGATLLPLGTIKKEDLEKFSDKKIIIHCKLGKRGSMACEKLAASNPSLQLYNIEGGITAWAQESLPTKKSGSKILSIDRQVQIAIGSGVLLGIVLGYFISPFFLLLSAFFGGGLLYAGLSGSCTLALIIAKMPWNQSQKTHCSH